MQTQEIDVVLEKIARSISIILGDKKGSKNGHRARFELILGNPFNSFSETTVILRSHKDSIDRDVDPYIDRAIDLESGLPLKVAIRYILEELQNMRIRCEGKDRLADDTLYLSKLNVDPLHDVMLEVAKIAGPICEYEKKAELGPHGPSFQVRIYNNPSLAHIQFWGLPPGYGDSHLGFGADTGTSMIFEGRDGTTAQALKKAVAQAEAHAREHPLNHCKACGHVISAK